MARKLWTVIKFAIILHFVIAGAALTSSVSPLLLAAYVVALIIAFWYWDKRKRFPAITENR